MYNKPNFIEYKKIMNVPIAVIIASFIIIIITTNMADSNGLSALLGGYSGLMLGMLFVAIINMIFMNTSYLDMLPIITVLIIISLLIYYLSTYFERISKGEVSGYYFSFSILSTIFLITQSIIIVKELYYKTGPYIFSSVMQSLLMLFGVINILIVITMGIILHYYSTQG